MADANYLGENTDVLLGQEFLTWLWFRSEIANGQLRMKSDGSAYAVFMEQRIVVRGGDGEAKETTSVSGTMSPFREARLGLTIGKQVIRALLRFEKDGMEWKTTVKAEDFCLGSLRTPTLPKEEQGDDPDARFLEKIYLLEQCLLLLDDAYVQFLDIRLSSEWQKEKERVARWMVQDIALGTQLVE